MALHNYNLSIFLLFGFVLSSCTATTGTKVSPSQSDLGKVKTIGLSVKKEEPFSVRISREQESAVGAVFFGLLGAGVEAAGRAATDAGYAEEIKPAVGDFDPKKVMNEKLIHYLESSKAFSKILTIDKENGTTTNEMKLDGVLEVTLKEWGLRLCVAQGMHEMVQVGVNMHGRMILLEDSNTIWERDELYLDGKCHRMEDFKSREGLLKESLSSAINNLSGKIVNYILFP